eukprot:jgi/Mesen1/8399/ME000468S07836
MAYTMKGSVEIARCCTSFGLQLSRPVTCGMCVKLACAGLRGTVDLESQVLRKDNGISSKEIRRAYRGHGSVAAALLPKDKKAQLLSGVDRSHVDIVARILDQASSAAKRWEIVHTDFLTPPAREDALMAVRRLADATAVISGGYSEAERCRLSVGHPEAMESGGLNSGGFPGAVAALSVEGNFSHDAAAHGDFLGAVLGCGITREKVGDIILQEGTGAHVLVVPELVSSVPVTVEQIPVAGLKFRAPKVDTVKTVEASMRVDAVASAGFRISRTKLSDLIDSGKVRVNWKEVTKGGVTLKGGDVVSVRGHGRLEVGEVSITKKARYAVELTRYI